MDCSTVLNYLDVYRTGELKEDERAAVSDHLAECPECWGDLARLRAFSGTAPRLAVAAPSKLAEQVLALTGDRYGSVETELGPAWVGFGSKGVTMIVPGGPARDFEESYRARVGRRPRKSEVPARLARAVAEAMAGRGVGRPPVDVSFLTDFQREVLGLLSKIPRGEVRPYSWIAREAGRPRAIRAAAGAIARNPVPFLVPCHRVVPLTGGVGKYAFGSAMKRRLLDAEGVALDDLEGLARRGVRFVGSRTTGIYCFPSCRDARRITSRHQIGFPDEAAALQAGYRPCKRCRPLAAAG